jgi:hypothetical protein
MKLIKIRNKFMFKSNNPNGTHTYLHYYNRKKKEVRLIQTTHLYEIPIKKQVAIKNGFLKEVKFKNLYLPSGVRDKYFRSDLNGKKLPYNSKKYLSPVTIPNKQAFSIIKFAKKLYR